jgi:hypothetical protein
LEQTEGDIPPNGRNNSPGYYTQTTKMEDFVLTVLLLVHTLIGMDGCTYEYSLSQNLCAPPYESSKVAIL